MDAYVCRNHCVCHICAGFDALRNVIEEKTRRELGVPRLLLQVRLTSEECHIITIAFVLQ